MAATGCTDLPYLDEVSKLDPALAKNFIVADVNVDGKLDIAEFETLLAGGNAASKSNKQ